MRRETQKAKHKHQHYTTFYSSSTQDGNQIRQRRKQIGQRIPSANLSLNATDARQAKWGAHSEPETYQHQKWKQQDENKLTKKWESRAQTDRIRIMQLEGMVEKTLRRQDHLRQLSHSLEIQQAQQKLQQHSLRQESYAAIQGEQTQEQELPSSSHDMPKRDRAPFR